MKLPHRGLGGQLPNHYAHHNNRRGFFHLSWSPNLTGFGIKGDRQSQNTNSPGKTMIPNGIERGFGSVANRPKRRARLVSVDSDTASAKCGTPPEKEQKDP